MVLAHLKSIMDPALDPLQFAYRANRSTEDAVNLALHYVLQHLHTAANYARILYVDFSLAFNTILPHILESRLAQLQVPVSTCKWITDFLTNRSQRVKLGSCTSSSRSTNTGSPQSCVLSPTLFSLCTNSCTSLDPSVKLLKFADRATAELVWQEQLGAQSSKDCGNGGGFPKKLSSATSPHAGEHPSGCCTVLPLPGADHLQ